nr:cytochrome c oxidase subunit 3 [Halipeurus diversus]
MKSLLSKLGFHPFHIVDVSPWPILASLSLFSVIINTFYALCYSSILELTISLSSLIMVIYQWWRDVVRESTYQGFHSNNVSKGLYLGICMFILSEVMFFFSVFFSYFFTSLNPDTELGSTWPPTGVQPMEYMGAPMLNSIILLSSGVSITWAHHCLLTSDYKNCLNGMYLTIMLGFLFSYFQFEEYLSCYFTMSDSVYGSLFFIATGFHGLHVIIGAVMISISTIRIGMLQMSKKHHIGFESSAWYWHFVDVVWMFLFICIYWWGY